MIQTETITAELALSLRMLEQNLHQEGATNSIQEILKTDQKKVEKLAHRLVRNYVWAIRARAEVQAVRYSYSDSSNITHGCAYFSVMLTGLPDDLCKVSGENSLLRKVH